MQVVESQIVGQFSEVGLFDDGQDGCFVVSCEFLVVLVAEGYLQASVVESLNGDSVILIFDQG